jgi:hypothetical protein
LCFVGWLDVVAGEEDAVGAGDLEPDLLVLAEGDVEWLLVELCNVSKRRYKLVRIERRTLLGSRVQMTYSSTSASSMSSSLSSSSSSSLTGILPNALADFATPLTPFGTSSSSSSSLSPSASSNPSSSSIFFTSCFAFSILAFLVLAGSLGPPLTSSSSSSLSSLYSSASRRSICSWSKSESESSSSESESSRSDWRMTLRVARGTTPSSPSGSAEGSMAAMVMRNAEGMSGRALMATSPAGTSRPYMAMGMRAIAVSGV